MRDENLTFRPYWDPVLRKRSELIKVVRALWRLRLVGFRRRLKAHVGLFVVKKKVGANGIPWQRLIIDARVTNVCHRPPPTTRLASTGGMVELDLADARLKAAGFGTLCELRPAGNLQLPHTGAGQLVWHQRRL